MTEQQLKLFAEIQVVLALVDTLGSELDEGLLARAETLSDHNEDVVAYFETSPNIEQYSIKIAEHGQKFVGELIQRLEEGINDDK